MNAFVYKIVLVVQNLKPKGKGSEPIAVVSGDVHYHKSTQEKIEYSSLVNQIADEKDLDKKNVLEMELEKIKHIASFQMALDSNLDLQKHINGIAMEAIALKEKK